MGLNDIVKEKSSGILGKILDMEENTDLKYGVLFTNVDEDNGLWWVKEDSIELATNEEIVEFQKWYEKKYKNI
jgi:hypothetical protein